MDKYDIVIGLEVHAQPKTAGKIFCACSTNFDSPANTNICPVCCGYPGVLPVFNKKALDLAIRVSLALNCKINNRIYFERKNYFYPDLPKNYQISQYKMPLAEQGFLELPSGKKIGITRVHLEEDAGKLIHKEDASLVDLNRAGIPLMEIVSQPDISSPQEALEYLTYLKMILQYIGVSDGDMEKGTLRCDANISLKPKGETKLGTRVELKNMNSFSGVKAGLEYEAQRQAQVLDSKEKVIQETRLWDVEKSRTVVMRAKEEAHDYRYFPEPDLPDFTVLPEFIAAQKQFIPELPLARRRRFLNQYKLKLEDIDILTVNVPLADFFEKACGFYNRPDKIANWLLGPFLEQMNLLPGKFNDVKLAPEKFAKIVQLFCEDKLNNLGAKKVLSLCVVSDDDVDAIVDREGLSQVSDLSALDELVKQVVAENPQVVKEYLAGKQQALMFFVGQVMKKSKGKANPKIVKDLLEKTFIT